MGSRKQKMAEAIKEERKTTYIARLRNCPTSPRKMRLVADLVRGKGVYEALNILHFSPKHAASRLEKLIRSAIANYEGKSGSRAEDESLYVREIYVDSAVQLKRLRTAPQGRGHRIRKRSNHITLVLGTPADIQAQPTNQTEE